MFHQNKRNSGHNHIIKSLYRNSRDYSKGFTRKKLMKWSFDLGNISEQRLIGGGVCSIWKGQGHAFVNEIQHLKKIASIDWE